MANSYYNYSSGTPVSISRGTSSLLRSEFTLIGQGFDALALVMGKNNGQAWTGNQDFTGATITVPTLSYGSSGAYAASVDYVNTALLNASYNLPGQAGNAGKFLKTNGTTASWAYPGIATVAATVTAGATLSATPSYVPVQMAALGQSVTLPAASSMLVGGPNFIIDNSKGAYPAGIRDNTGTLLQAVAPGGVVMVSLKDNSSAAGVWAINGTALEPGLVTFDTTFSTTYLGNVFPQFLALDNNTSLHFAALSSGFAAFILDNAGKVVSTPVTVTSTANSVPCAVFKISATQAILFYGQSNINTDHNAVVLTLSGASPSLSLSVGTAASLTATGAVNGAWQENGLGAPNIAQLSASLYVASYTPSGTPNGTVVAIAVSGTTITIGTPVSAITNNQNIIQTAIYALSATTALLIGGSSGTGANAAAVITVSGTTCTVGTVTNTGIGTNSTVPSIAVISSSKVLLVNTSPGGAAQAVALTISGTTVSAGAVVTVDASIVAGQAAYTTSGATRFNPHLWVISAGATNLVGCWLADSSNISRLYVLSETGGTITVGPKLAGGVSMGAADAAGNGVILPQGTTEAVALRAAQASTAGYGLQLVPIKINGTTMTNGYGVALREVTQNRPGNFSYGKLASGDYAVLNMGSAAAGQVRLPIFRSNGDTINLRGAVSIPELTLNALVPIPAVSASRFAVIGGTVNGGTSQLRVLILEVAA